ncbi:proteasome assembly chaperone 1 [Prorops nasuta]|uniref:proteasome assembly chaperone 1 n=1 Tax=Prorops nasuta TaxID=863751 RepID=UPI0034CEC62C
MVSHFGEVVYPVSRAFWGEEDELEDLHLKTKVTPQWLDDIPEKITRLLIVEGSIVNEFINESYCRTAKTVCIINNEKAISIATLYKYNVDLYVLLISSEFDLKYTGAFIKEIADILSNTYNIILINSYHISQFKGIDASEKLSFLRSLRTKNAGKEDYIEIKSLEQPNIVHGIAAGVLTYAEIMNLSAVLYILYADSFTLDSVNAEPLIRLFSNLMPFANTEFNFGKDKFFSKGNLYM